MRATDRSLTLPATTCPQCGLDLPRAALWTDYDKARHRWAHLLSAYVARDMRGEAHLHGELVDLIDAAVGWIRELDTARRRRISDLLDDIDVLEQRLTEALNPPSPDQEDP